MASTTFVDGVTKIVASWLNDVNAVAYTTVPAIQTTLATTVVTRDSATGAAALPSGTTAQRPVAPSSGFIRYNSTTTSFEGYNGTVWGPMASGFATSGANNDITSLTGLTSPIRQVREIQPISASVSGNALTISASALSLEFRSATLGSGAVSFVQGTPANLVISSGSTLGTINATQSRIVVLAINNAGTIELAAVNIAGGNDLSETGLISTTAEGGAGAADSASVIYSTTARASVAYRVIGYIESTQSTAGTWATAPSTIQGRGGNALAAMSSLGYGQTWQVVTGSRVFGTTYYNTTGKPIGLFVFQTPVSSITRSVTVSGTTWTWFDMGPSATVPGNLSLTIPPGASYSVSGGTSWQELR